MNWFLKFVKGALENTCLPKIFWDDNNTCNWSDFNWLYKGKREGGGYTKESGQASFVILKREGGKEGRGGILQMNVIYECLTMLDYVFYLFHLEIR